MTTRKKSGRTSDVRVHSWEELLDEFYSDFLIPNESSSGGHLRSGFVFRGMANAAWGLMTSIERLGTPPEAVEAHALRAFSKYAPTGSYRADSHWERLAVAQHHGLPTRLLDWTVSPLIAAHFATAELQNADVDAAIWCFNAWNARYLMPKQMVDVLEAKGAWTFDVDILDEAYPRLEDFDGLPGDVMMLFEPPSISARIQNQYAVLSAMNGAAKNHGEYLESVASEHPDLVRRIVIDKDAKPKIRDMLDQNNINERMLFPGLPGLCDWLRRYYSPARP